MKFARRARMVVARYLDFLRRLFNVNQIKGPYPAKCTGAAIATIAIICGTIATVQAAPAWPVPVPAATKSQFAAEPAPAPSPSDQPGDDDQDVPASQVDKYIAVYEAMQKDHNLTVEQAASKQGLTVAQFRGLEARIERDDTLREQVRKALRHQANPKDTDSSDD
jgi:hypothetical protein